MGFLGLKINWAETVKKIKPVTRVNKTYFTLKKLLGLLIFFILVIAAKNDTNACW